MNNEIWKPIPGFSSYEASNLGRIRSYLKRIRSKQKWELAEKPQRILKVSVRPDGRRFVRLRINGNGYTRRIASLVALAFIGPKPDGMQVCHNDNNVSNDCANNLRYDTPKANIRDSLLADTFPKKFSNEKALEIRNRRANGESILELADEFNVCYDTIEAICAGRTYLLVDGPITKGKRPDLSNQKIKQLREERRETGAFLDYLAQKYGITESYASLLIRGKRRKDAGGPME